MKLDLRFSDRSPEKIWCQAVTAFAFQRPDLEILGLKKMDMKMGGALSDLILKELWTGERGELFLLSSQGTIPAEKILFHGLGPASEFNVDILKSSAQSLGYSLNKLAVNDFSIYLPPLEGLEKEYATYLEYSLPVLAKTLFEAHEKQEECFIKIVCCVKQELIYQFIPIIDRLREYFLTFMECSIVIGYGEEKEESAA